MKEKIIRHFRELMGDDRRLRFGRSMNDSALEVYVESAVGKAEMVQIEDSDRVVGLAEVVDGGDWLEGAFSVTPDQRGKGLGHRLVQSAIDKAIVKGKPLVLYVDPENGPMRALARGHGFTVVTADRDLITYLSHI